MLALSLLALPAIARADAASDFAAGQKAYQAGDFREAAAHFEAAYVAKPHHGALWNAGRSWEQAGEPVRAANDYAKFLLEAPAGARERDQATERLKTLATKLGRLELTGEGLRVDGAAVTAASMYVAPGEHVVERAPLPRKVVKVGAGEVLSVAMEPEPVRAAVPAPIPVPAPVPAPVPEHRGLPWAVFAVSAGVTVVAGGLTIASGVHTLSKRSDFDSSPSQSTLDDGRSSQTVTNVLLGTTAGLAVLTGVLAVFTDFHGGAWASASGGGVSMTRAF